MEAEMANEARIGIIGDYKPDSRTHQATIESIEHAAKKLGMEVEVEWLPTPSLKEHAESKLKTFDGLWCAPGGPYESLAGALNGIRFAREGIIETPSEVTRRVQSSLPIGSYFRTNESAGHPPKYPGSCALS